MVVKPHQSVLLQDGCPSCFLRWVGSSAVSVSVEEGHLREITLEVSSLPRGGEYHSLFISRQYMDWKRIMS